MSCAYRGARPYFTQPDRVLSLMPSASQKAFRLPMRPAATYSKNISIGMSSTRSAIAESFGRPSR
jgi:hypothetical protein